MTRAALVLFVLLGFGLPPVSGSVQELASPLRPDTVLTPPAGPRTVVMRAPGAPVLALRLHVPLREGPPEAGVGEVLRRMGFERARPIADQIGAGIDAVRTSTGIAYTVTGPAADFDHLVWILRSATAEPGPERFRRVRNELRAELERRAETPAGVLGALLRTRVAPLAPPPEGTLPSLETLDHARALDAWRRSHGREDLTVVLVGPVATEVVLAALLDLGVARSEEVADDGQPTGSSPEPPGFRPEVLRHWYGEAYPAADADDPRPLVAARLLSERLREVPGEYETGVEAWEVGDQVVLSVVGAAYPRNASSLRTRVQGLRAETAANLTSEAVERARARFRRDLLSEARTPRGLVNLIGKRMELSPDPLAAERYLERIDGIDLAGMEAYLRELAEVEARTAEVRP